MRTVCKDERDYFGYERDFPTGSDLQALEKRIPDEDSILDEARTEKREQNQQETVFRGKLMMGARYIDANLLIIGGGSAGCLAAIRALEINPELNAAIF